MKYLFLYHGIRLILHVQQQLNSFLIRCTSDEHSLIFNQMSSFFSNSLRLFGVQSLRRMGFNVFNPNIRKKLLNSETSKYQLNQPCVRMHWTSLYRAPLATQPGHHWRTVQTCSPQDPPTSADIWWLLKHYSRCKRVVHILLECFLVVVKIF